MPAAFETLQFLKKLCCWERLKLQLPQVLNPGLGPQAFSASDARLGRGFLSNYRCPPCIYIEGGSRDLLTSPSCTRRPLRLFVPWGRAQAPARVQWTGPVCPDRSQDVVPCVGHTQHFETTWPAPRSPGRSLPAAPDQPVPVGVAAEAALAVWRLLPTWGFYWTHGDFTPHVSFRMNFSQVRLYCATGFAAESGANRVFCAESLCTGFSLSCQAGRLRCLPLISK